MRFNAVFDNVVVEVDAETQMKKTSGGIYIQAQKSDLTIGTVVAFGEGTNRFRNKNGDVLAIGNLKVGDKVLFKDSTASDLELFGKKYKLIDYACVIGYLSDDNEPTDKSIVIGE